MNICLVSHFFCPHIGGIEHFVYEQAQALVRSGHTVSVLCSNTHPETKIEVLDNLRVVRLASLNPFERYGIPYPLPLSLLRLFREISQADLVIGHGHMYLTCLLAATITRLHKSPFVTIQHNTPIKFESQIFNLLQTVCDRSIGKLNLFLAKHIFVGSEATRDYVNHILGPSPHRAIQVLRTGVDLTRFTPVTNRAEIRRALGVPESSFLCVTVRRFTRKNGIDVFIQAAKALRHSGIYFLIGGAGPEFEKIQTDIQEADLREVKLLGEVEAHHLSGLMSCSDLFVLPSRNGEGFPLVIPEALACGTPVLATRSGGHASFYADCPVVTLVDVNSAEALAEGLARLASLGPPQEPVRQSCRSYAEAMFSWDRSAHELMNTVTDHGT